MDSLRPHELAIHDQLRMLALPHLERYGGTLELLPLDPQEYPAQDLGTSVIEGAPIAGAIIESLGAEVNPAFPSLVAHLKQAEEERGELSRLGSNLESGQNVIVVTNHGELTDIALTLAAFYGELQEMGYTFRSDIIISKMISHIGYHLPGGTASAVELLRGACDEVFLSFPSTDSIKQSEIDSAFVRQYNKKLLGLLAARLKMGGNLFAMAASGAVDKPLPDDETTIKLGGLSPNTAQLMMAPGSVVVPIAVWLKDSMPVFEICDEPYTLHSPEDAHMTMERITGVLNQEVPGKTFVYDGPQTSRQLGSTSLAGLSAH